MMSTVDREIRERFYTTLRRFGIMKNPYIDFTGATLTKEFIEDMNKVMYENFGKPNTNTLAISPKAFEGLKKALLDADSDPEA